MISLGSLLHFDYFVGFRFEFRFSSAAGSAGIVRVLVHGNIAQLGDPSCGLGSVVRDVSPLWKMLTIRLKASCFLINLQIGIGVLALPTTLHTIGMIPGIILIIASGLITTWADTVIGLFKRGHPEVYSIADVGGIMAGRFGRELFGGMYWVSYFQ